MILTPRLASKILDMIKSSMMIKINYEILQPYVTTMNIYWMHLKIN